MTEMTNLVAESRERAGKGSSRAARRAGKVPAVIYGGKKDPVIINLPQNEIIRLINRGGFMTRLFEIELDGKKERAMCRDLQKHVVSDMPTHIDFLRVTKGMTVVMELPVNFINDEDCPGLRAGGVLNAVRHSIECHVPAENIPSAIDIDLASLELGDSVHISAVTLPEGVTPTIDDRDFTIATVVAPSGLKSASSEDDEDGAEEAAGEAAAEEASEE